MLMNVLTVRAGVAQLSDASIWSVVIFAKRLWPVHNRQQQQQNQQPQKQLSRLVQQQQLHQPQLEQRLLEPATAIVAQPASATLDEAAPVRVYIQPANWSTNSPLHALNARF